MFHYNTTKTTAPWLAVCGIVFLMIGVPLHSFGSSSNYAGIACYEGPKNNKRMYFNLALCCETKVGNMPFSTTKAYFLPKNRVTTKWPSKGAFENFCGDRGREWIVGNEPFVGMPSNLCSDRLLLEAIGKPEHANCVAPTNGYWAERIEYFYNRDEPALKQNLIELVK